MINLGENLWSKVDELGYQNLWAKQIEEEKSFEEEVPDDWEWLYNPEESEHCDDDIGWDDWVINERLFFKSNSWRPILDVCEIAQAWALTFDNKNGKSLSCKTYEKLLSDYKKLLTTAAFNEQLKAKTYRKNILGEFKYIGDSMLAKSNFFDALDCYWSEGAPKIDYKILVHRNDFIDFIAKMKKKVDSFCLLNEWLISDSDQKIKERDITKNRIVLIKEYFDYLCGQSDDADSMINVSQQLSRITNGEIYENLLEFSRHDSDKMNLIRSPDQVIDLIAQAGRDYFGEEWVKKAGRKKKSTTNSYCSNC